MSIQRMVSSTNTPPANNKTTPTENFIKELLESLAEIMETKIHLENENNELKRKCQSQKQKIEAFKELALGEKAFLLGVIRRECFERPEEGNTENSEKIGDGGKLRTDKKLSVGAAMIDKKVSVSPKINNQQNKSEETAEVRNLQKVIQQHFADVKNREESLLLLVQQLKQQMSDVQKKCDCMQNRLSEIMQVDQKALKHKTRTSLKVREEKEAQTDSNVAKKLCKCGGVMSRKEEEILSELFFQRF